MTAPKPPGRSPPLGVKGFSPRLGTIGPYKILELLGQGGMAAVYLARDERSGEEVAVKVLSRLRPTWVQRFAREFDAARRVEHPNVVKVLEAGESEGLAYYSMERIEGVTAARYVLDLAASDPLPPQPPVEHRGPPLPLSPQLIQRTLDVAIQLCGAVGAIHQVGLVHRDLKPGNVLVDGEGLLKLVDFGVAKWLEEQTSFTQVGHVVGSYSYMSPEQITGAVVDHRADMYGMGILLYELLTGAPPFRARRPQEYLWLHCTAQPEPISRRLAPVPPGLDALLLRMLAKEPADRPENTRVIEEELRAIHADLQTEAEGALAQPAADPYPELPDDIIIEFEPDTPADQTIRSEAFSENRRPLATSSESPDAGSPGAPARPPTSTESTRVKAPEARPEPRRSANSSAALAALVTPRHVGRKPELDFLIKQLKAVKGGTISAVLVEGEEGLGKTRLLHTFRGLAWVKGARVAIGRCHSGGGAFCAPFHDILLRIAGPGLARSHHERVLGADKELLVRFFPALADRAVPQALGMRDLGAEQDDLAVLYRGVGDVFRRAAEDAPLVVGIEDVQWADRGTIRLILTLLRRLTDQAPSQVLLVMTYRGEAVDDSRQSSTMLIPAVAGLENVHLLSLKPLQEEETLELIRSITVDVELSDSVATRLARDARGNPRFAVEVARTLVEAGGPPSTGNNWELPTTLLAAYSRRLAMLSKQARDVARCIALLGGQPPLPIVETASGLDDTAFSEAITELEQRRVVELDHRSDIDSAALHSEALRRAILDSVSSAQSRALHLRSAAAWLKHSGNSSEAAGHAARHLYAAGERRAAFPHALAAAHQAGDALDYATVQAWMEQIGDPGEALGAVSAQAVYRYHKLRFLCAFSDGQLELAQKSIAQAAEAAPDLKARLSTGVACARLHTRTGNYLGAVKVCRKGLQEARAEDCTEHAVLFAIQGARAARRSGDNDSALAWLSEADLLLGANPGLDNLEVRTAWTRSAVLLELRRDDEAEREIHRAIDLATRTHQERSEAGLRTNLSVVYWRRGEIEKAVEEVVRSVEIFESVGERDQVALNESNLAELRLRQGRLTEALRAAQSAWETFQRLQDRQGVLVSATSLLGAARALQDEDIAAPVLDALGEGPAAGEPLEALWANFWTECLRWHLSRNQVAGARKCIARAERALGPTPSPHRKHDVDLAHAEFLYLLGDHERALPLAEGVARGAEEQQHWPVAWRARARRSALRARLDLHDRIAQPPPHLVLGNVPLALATARYLSDTYRARGDDERARIHEEEGAELALSTGYADWMKRFGRD